MAKAKTVFYCTNCGNETPKWMGRCPSCGAYNTMEEHVEKPVAAGKAKSAPVGMSRKPQRIREITSDGEIRFSTGMGELDRVLGGGAVAGSLVLVGGAPGIGKSTLLLQICSSLCVGRRVLYVSGEESERQLKLRAERLGVAPEELFILSETRLSDIVDAAEAMKPDILIVDSIQTLYNEENESSPGSVSQVKDCTMTMMQLSKSQGITVFVVGHINKDGNIAGPKVLEHMVDCVLYFEGDPKTHYRLLRAEKNRFGSTNEIGVFEMGQNGLREVPNPSEALLSGRPLDCSGSCITCLMEGTRPILVEIQALVTKTSFGNPRRVATGFDMNRTAMLLAVLEKRAGFYMGNLDVFVNAAGGMRADEPSADLAVAMAVLSNLLDKVIPDDMLLLGEIGLAGEIRSTPQVQQRVGEGYRLGFRRFLLPKSSMKTMNTADYPEAEFLPVGQLSEAVRLLRN